jgi:signal transduction histidine kinase
VKRRKTLEQAIFEAVERAHTRFASDIHDGICQELASIAMMLDATLDRAAPDVSKEIRTISEHVRRVTVDARRLAIGLAPIVVERAGLAGALALLKLNVETFRGTSVVVSVDEPLVRDLPLNVAVNLYRIAQEATANALRHGNSSNIDISVEVCPARLLLTIQDDGCGIQAAGGEIWSLGMKSMALRAQWLGGELALLAGTPHGTRVQVIVPMD